MHERNQPNDDINYLRIHTDVVKDDLGNYYTANRSKHEGDKLLSVNLAHFYYEVAFTSIFTEELIEEYQHKLLGDVIREMLLERIEEMNSNGRMIFTVQELLDNDIEVTFKEVTEKRVD
ncbi:hypothetical protein VBD025_01300 [Virgibacillus flavescens]|uniref:hypothetical protein n=1 Tax=Virgibacillus flavescens TaxID=1611422 RepID=UPI003D34FDA6